MYSVIRHLHYSIAIQRIKTFLTKANFILTAFCIADNPIEVKVYYKKEKGQTHCILDLSLLVDQEGLEPPTT